MTFSMGYGRQESGSNKCKAIRLLTCDGTMSVIERILLQKSKIDQPRKSRDVQFLDVATAATLCSGATKVRDRFV
jgi:hypothetical protein